MQTVTTKQNILIIDDEEDILTTCQNILEDEGYGVDIAKNYKEAEYIFNSKKINLVFLDVWLPDVDGLDILSNIKEKYPNTTVIMMSGHAGVETAVRATKMGAYDFLEKPISISKLLSSCEDVFKESIDKAEVSVNEENCSNKHCGNVGYKIKQRTIAKSIVVSGFALMEGRKTALTLVPADVNTGIVFIDINTNTHIKLSHNNILSKDKSGAVNSTALVCGNRYIKTTEHFLAALHMMGITNLIVKCDGEVPNVDGSALVFCNALKEAGFVEQDGYIEPIVIDTTLTYGNVNDNETYIILSPYDGLEVSLRIDFAGSIGVQEYTYKFENFDQFTDEIGRARSFNTIDNIDYAQKMGMAGSGMIGSHIILCDGKVINTKLHFDNEFVRHKILDIIGDLYILGRPIRGKVVANKSSHSFNHSVVHDLANRYL
ncbi:UDP-3-O-acyl-N-acetylglucosamine deacetylase [Brachyspira hampsonii]|uniref:UDP-3-O-acyl-N-acetylglucosamine deacetylase n=1 Tax=Brachyspira hampsonii 30446 TaxID=1289135 RepID=A0A2U4F0L1_9SPIR|nr:UDP-3-O-acyl-N-acetylglucosamine deacetylase [Brachyspira hampsonii]EKV57722.1 UDP-3-O-acyl-N-acetylglucosamine deacetylase [Brachyspira hampsonii 30446]MBW5388689.1 UDP-3-O-[3-hydroxymyristoyl] N-acetylglucosamine deacetylase [Brachyspira hampsonii]MBW5394203.1 UDP-3-O-[3-hydroxymyristoyl] N-acetylglucosamine deacetylase [Brachyspira hampsonii]OEJ17002.1 UDP-3-O-[3-hydroxymyristoyl] N-acetylglucosamine deacetylase [Brachyspira hampsonii]